MSGWKQSLKQIAPGLYVDDQGSLHIDMPELLRANGYAATPANQKMMQRVIAEYCLENKVTPIIEENA